MPHYLQSCKKSLFAFLLLLFANFSFSQASFLIKGSVKDINEENLIGVNVVMQNGTLGTITDVDGSYELKGNLPEGTYNIVFSYVGYGAKTESVVLSTGNNDIMLNVTLGNDALALDEVVVTGSSLNAPKRQLGNAITSIKAADLEKSGTGNALTSLQGRVPGAKITQTGGDPAGAINISLRGVNSISGGSDPLYVIDGVIVSNSSVAVTQTGNNAGEGQVGTPRLADINPNDIETINVINGAAAAAIYGSRASNGVVLITTKRGTTGKPKITVGTSLNINQLRKKVYISTYGKQFGFEALRLGNISNVSAAQIAANPGTTTIAVTRDGAVVNLPSNLVDVTRYDYQDQIFQTGIGNDHFINISGGSEKTKYFAGVSYLKNEGIIKNTDFSRLGLRLNLDQIITSWASLSVGLNAIRSASSELPTGNVFWSPINSVNITNNIWDITQRDANGNLKAAEPSRINPLSAIETFDINQNVNRALSNVKLSIFPLEGLQLDLIAGLDGFSQVGTQYVPLYPYAGVNPAFFANGYASTANNVSFQYNTDINLTYNKNFGDFSSNTAVGYNYQNSRVDYTQSNGENIAPGFLSVNGSPNRQTTYSLSQYWIDGYYAQQTFGFKNQIFLTGAARVDNSSIFSESSRNQLYTKASMSWVISESSFWKNASMNKIWNSAKLRASFGEAGGVAAIGPYDRFNLISSNVYNGKNTLTPNTQLAFENVAPERTREFEFGADLSFFNNKLGLGLTYYNQKVFDLLVNKQLAASEGGTSRLDNVGEMQNKGFELSLNYNAVKTKNLDWDVYAVYSQNDNLITKLGSPTVAINTVSGAPVFLIEGRPASVFYGTFYARDDAGNTLKTPQGLEQTEKGSVTLYKSGEAIPAGSYVEGGFLYTPKRDANGQPTGVALRKIIGDPNPDFTLSIGTNLKYKKISFGFLLDGVYGAEVFNADRRTRQGVGIGDYSEKELKGELPRGYIHSIYLNEEWRIDNGSFTKIREMSLGYQLPDNLIKGVSDINFTIIGRNLYSFDSYDGYDPETNAGGVSDRLRGVDFGNVPIPRTIMFSLRGSF
jgi:TonB-linked SusC/RagA family outer membrane protein